jgi:hypothetical protein
MKDRIKFGPADETATISELVSKRFHFSEAVARDLVTRAKNSPSGMAREPWTDYADVWVTALCTMPGKFLIEWDDKAPFRTFGRI